MTDQQSDVLVRTVGPALLKMFGIVLTIFISISYYVVLLHYNITSMAVLIKMKYWAKCLDLKTVGTEVDRGTQNINLLNNVTAVMSTLTVCAHPVDGDGANQCC